MANVAVISRLPFVDKLRVIQIKNNTIKVSYSSVCIYMQNFRNVAAIINNFVKNLITSLKGSERCQSKYDTFVKGKAVADYLKYLRQLAKIVTRLLT